MVAQALLHAVMYALMGWSSRRSGTIDKHFCITGDIPVQGVKYIFFCSTIASTGHFVSAGLYSMPCHPCGWSMESKMDMYSSLKVISSVWSL